MATPPCAAYAAIPCGLAVRKQHNCCSPPASLKIVNDNLTKERERMKKIMFGNSLMLLGIAIMILAGLKVIYVGTLWVSFLLIIVGFVMATIGFFGKDSK